MSPTFVRVKAENGYHVTVTESFAEANGLKPLKEPAVDRRGRPLPEAPSTAAAKKAADKPAPGSANPSGSQTAASNQEENQ